MRWTGWLRAGLFSCWVVGLLSVIAFAPFGKEYSWGELNWLGSLTGGRRARFLLEHRLQAEVARSELVVDLGQELPRRFHPGQAVVGDLQISMEIREALELGWEDDLLELFLLAHAEAVAQVARAELAALELLDNLPLAKGLRQKLGRRGVGQAEAEMHVEIVEEGLLLVRAVDVGHGTERLVGKE